MRFSASTPLAIRGRVPSLAVRFGSRKRKPPLSYFDWADELREGSRLRKGQNASTTERRNLRSRTVPSLGGKSEPELLID
jgi:hypothetical protein